MLNLNALEAFKEVAPFISNTIPQGIIFTISDTKNILWKSSSRMFDLPTIQIGDTIPDDSVLVRCLKDKQISTARLAKNVHGIRLIVTSIPAFEGEKAKQALSVFLPVKHPIVLSFYDFAPIIANLFPEGAFMYNTDPALKIGERQGSDNFDIPSLTIGTYLSEDSLASQAMKTGMVQRCNYDADVYGVPTLAISNPIFDEVDKKKVIASFNVITPRKNTVAVEQMAGNLAESLNEISLAIQQLTESASTINNNEILLNQKIIDIDNYADQINEITDFIKQIADETKMLGLNAAIEAARAGENGRGFGVVSEQIMKLSDQSKQTVKNISQLIQDIKSSVTVTVDNSHKNMCLSEEQAAATQEINAGIQEINSLAEELDALAKRL